MSFLVNLLAGIATASTTYSLWWTWDEPECPEELL